MSEQTFNTNKAYNNIKRGDNVTKYRVDTIANRDKLITEDRILIGHQIYFDNDSVADFPRDIYKLDKYPTFGSLTGVEWKKINADSDGIQEWVDGEIIRGQVFRIHNNIVYKFIGSLPHNTTNFPAELAADKWVKVLGGDNQTTQIKAKLSNGKNIGKYSDGDTIPAFGSVAELLQDLAIEFTPPRLNITPRINTSPVQVGFLNFDSIEVGSTWKIDFVGVYNANDYGDVTMKQLNSNNPAFSVDEFNNNTELVVTKTIVFGSAPINVNGVCMYNGKLQTINDIDYQLDGGFVSAPELTLQAHRPIFYGSSATKNNDNTAIRANLNKRLTNVGDFWTLNTGNTDKVMQIWLPDGVELEMIRDMDAMNLIITDSYVVENKTILDLNGNSIVGKLYTYEMDVAYSEPHEHQIIVSGTGMNTPLPVQIAAPIPQDLKKAHTLVEKVDGLILRFTNYLEQTLDIDLSSWFDLKVDKVDGKGLSANDYTDDDKTAVDSIGNKVDKVNGKELSTNDYTDDDKATITMFNAINKRCPVSQVSGTFEFDWSLYDTWVLEMTGNTVFSDKANSYPISDRTKDIEIILIGNFAPDFPANWKISSGNYDGTGRRQIVATLLKSSPVDIIAVINDVTELV